MKKKHNIYTHSHTKENYFEYEQREQHWYICSHTLFIYSDFMLLRVAVAYFVYVLFNFLCINFCSCSLMFNSLGIWRARKENGKWTVQLRMVSQTNGINIFNEAVDKWNICFWARRMREKNPFYSIFHLNGNMKINCRYGRMRTNAAKRENKMASAFRCSLMLKSRIPCIFLANFNEKEKKNAKQNPKSKEEKNVIFKSVPAF